MCASDPTGPHNRILEREGAWELRLAPEVSVEQSQMARQQELAHREQRIQAAEGIEADGDHTAGQLAYLRSEIQEKDQQLMELAVRCEDTYREAEDAKKKAHSAQQKYEEESLMSPLLGGAKSEGSMDALHWWLLVPGGGPRAKGASRVFRQGATAQLVVYCCARVGSSRRGVKMGALRIRPASPTIWPKACWTWLEST